MYILKNAFTSIKRNKGRNILIAIIIIVIAASCAVTLAIRKSAKTIVEAYENKYQVQATIGMNRQNLMKNLKDGDKSQEEMIDSFNDIKSLSEEEIINYGTSNYIKNYYYTYSLGVNAENLTEATDSLVKETTETSTKTTTRQFPGEGKGPGGFGGTREESTTTTKRTEKIYNEKAQSGAFTLIGYNSYEDMQEFINGNYEIVEGTVSSDFNSNSCVISEELATLNEVSVGNTITIIDVKDTSKTYELVVTGIYKENTDNSNDMSSMFTNSANNIITNINFVKNIVSQDDELSPTITPTFILNDKNDIEAFKNEVSEKGLSEYYQITDNVETIKSATKSIDNVKTFATTFLIITLIIGSVVLVVINMINIRERKYEIGVLRTIGMKKSLVSLQFMLELLIVSFIGLIIGAGIGSTMSVPIANNLLASEIQNSTNEYQDKLKNFGGEERKDTKDYNFGVAKVEQVDDINAVVDMKVLAELLGIGILLTLLSSLASMIAISRFSPLTILKERS